MRNHTYLKLITLCCFLGCTLGLSAQNGIGLFTRFVLNPNGEVRALSTEPSNFLAFQGLGFEYRRDSDKHKLYAINVGFNIRGKMGPGYSTENEYFTQVSWKLFKPVVNESGIKGYFSIGPRLFYISHSFLADVGSSESSFEDWDLGLDLQIGFNLEYALSDNIKLTGYINSLDLVFTSRNTEFVSPDGSRRRSNFSFYRGDANLFNEVRVGFSYLLGNEK